MEGLRRLRVFDEAPPSIRVQWKCRRSNLTVMVWWASEGGGDWTFGQIFDAVPERNHAGHGPVNRLWVFWCLR